MRGIRNIAGLCMWVNNDHRDWMASVLKDERPLSPEKQDLLQEVGNAAGPFAAPKQGSAWKKDKRSSTGRGLTQ